MDCDQKCHFAEYYEFSNLAAIKALELDVFGTDYGGTSWTTSDQARLVASSLALDANSRLLEVGSGSGWPGLFLAKTTDCEVVLLDMPFNALAYAAERAASDGTAGRVHLVNGDATALPFNNESFSCLSHSDVLCCLPTKLEMLQECRRVATTGGRMHFSVILPAPDLSPSDYQKVVDAGPPYVGLSGSYDSLLTKASWQVLERVDVTAEFGNSLKKFITALRKNTPELKKAFGAQELRDEWRQCEVELALVRAGLYQREIFVAVAT